jgi:Flp pilus assembly pilin Flp
VISADSRKKLRAPSLISGITSTDHRVRSAKGGGTHHTIVDAVAAQEGQAAVEYAVLLSLIAAVLFVGYQLLGEKTVQLFERVTTAFS